ncbi:MAG: hypothetical protein AB2A00_22635 [Myxococcota bacterium]
MLAIRIVPLVAGAFLLAGCPTGTSAADAGDTCVADESCPLGVRCGGDCVTAPPQDDPPNNLPPPTKDSGQPEEPHLNGRILDLCYSPCRADFQDADGGQVRCSSEGLMLGCPAGTVCRAGSCLTTEVSRSCYAEVDCPDFQTCIDGECRSTCESNDDCDPATACYRHVCRPTCSVGDTTCPTGTACSLRDGVQGHCMAVQAMTDTPTQDADGGSTVVGEGPSVEGRVGLVVDTVHLGPTHTSESLRLYNQTAVATTFTLRKVQHSRPNASGNWVVVAGTSDTPALPWLTVSYRTPAGGLITADPNGDVRASLEAGETGTIEITRNDAVEMPEQWRGMLEVTGPGNHGPLPIEIFYVADASGRWMGDALYFASFSVEGIDAWRASGSRADEDRIGNALLRRWRDFVHYHKGELGYAPMPRTDLAGLLQSIEDETWRQGSTTSICPKDSDSNPRNDPVCYLSDNTQGYSLLSPNGETYPVPWGASALPIALNLQSSVGGEQDGELVGKIDSGVALQYGGDPEIRLAFKDGQDPRTCPNQDSMPDGASCIVELKSLSSTIVVPGRYRDHQLGCTGRATGGFVKRAIPWLVPGFVGNAYYDDDKDGYFYDTCRSTSQPLPDPELNGILAEANPIPDALSRSRTLELIDGALIDGRDLVIFFRENMRSLMDPSQVVHNYGLMKLRRAGAPTGTDAYVANVQTEEDANLEPETVYQCTDALRRAVSTNAQPLPLNPAAWTALDIRRGARLMIAGKSSEASGVTIPHSEVHWVCINTEVNVGQDVSGSAVEKGYFDGGPDGTHACSEGAQVRFFLLRHETGPTVNRISVDQLRTHPCNVTGTCQDTYEYWRTGVVETDAFGSGTPRAVADYFKPNPFWECDAPGQVQCTADTVDPRQGKTFFEAAESGAQFAPIRQEITEAFRYRTEFTSNTGIPLGFVPTICLEGTGGNPYCYDPKRIEGIADRVDCLLSLFHAQPAAFQPTGPDDDLRATVVDYLRENFSYRTEHHLGGNPHLAVCIPGSSPACLEVQYMGFERLYGELMNLLGDESYTASFASRFDLAQIHNHAFNGTAFEGTLGLELSGGVGYEMYLLYQAVQYYEQLMERFARLTRALGRTIQDFEGVDTAERSYLSQEMVTAYFDRLIRASTQKSRAFSEVARRYVKLNRPALARRVIERGYTATYLEFILFNRLMDSVIRDVGPSARAQIEYTQQTSALRYRMALLDMYKKRSEITDDVTLFGFEPDYIPFPVVGMEDVNGVETLLRTARSQMLVAAEKEELAIASNAGAAQDFAAFQNQLSAIKSTYEDQLADLCGTVAGDEGGIYPALSRYAHLFKDADALAEVAEKSRNLLLQDPCGRFGTGELFEARQQVFVAQLAYSKARQKFENTKSAMAKANETVTAKCNVDFDVRHDVRWRGLDDDYTSADDRIDKIEDQMRENDAAYEVLMQTGDAAADCLDSQVEASAAELPMQGLARGGAIAKCAILGGEIAATVAHTTANVIFDRRKAQAEGDKEEAARQLALEQALFEHTKQCEVLRIDLQEQLSTLLGELTLDQIEILSAIQGVQLAMSEVQRLETQATMLQSEYEEKSQLALNTAAAASDPNTRIYKNDAVITADHTFERALKTAYKATRVFEYYTSQSFAEFESLLLARTVTHGDYSLESYLNALEDAYIAYQETFGAPDRRLLIKSIRDDVLYTQLYGDNGVASSQRVRDAEFRALLTNPRNKDANGYIVIPFALGAEETSPLTHNHKIHHIKVEFLYQGNTDAVARVYLRPFGTSLVRDREADPTFYRLPAQTAVINPFFNGGMLEGDVGASNIDESIYASYRLADRPLLNTRWELTLNLVDEPANEDIRIDDLKDIRVYFYYSDFTYLP